MSKLLINPSSSLTINQPVPTPEGILNAAIDIVNNGNGKKVNRVSLSFKLLVTLINLFLNSLI
jgi:hypothetical protein